MGASEATLLNMLNISPFSFGLVIQQVFDNGSIYNPEVLDITEDTLHKRFLEVSTTTQICCVLLLCLTALAVKCHVWCAVQASAELGAIPAALQEQSIREYFL